MTKVYWTGSSGKKYEMEIFRLGIAVPCYPGVYVLCKPQDRIWSPYFVGEAENIGSRLSESKHLGRDCAMRQGARYVAAAHVDGGKSARLRVERDLLGAYDPPCNG